MTAVTSVMSLLLPVRRSVCYLTAYGTGNRCHLAQPLVVLSTHLLTALLTGGRLTEAGLALCKLANTCGVAVVSRWTSWTN